MALISEILTGIRPNQTFVFLDEKAAAVVVVVVVK